MKQDNINAIDYEKEVKDIDDIEGTDIKINPDFYIHNALLKAQAALSKDNIQEGFMQYRQLIEFIEVLCKAANMLDEEYTKAIDEFKKQEEYKQSGNETVKSMKLANKKLGLMMKEVFNSKTITSKLKF